MYTLTCKNHPTAVYLTKNPYQRNLHIIKFPEGTFEECACDFSDLIVTKDEDTVIYPPIPVKDFTFRSYV